MGAVERDIGRGQNLAGADIARELDVMRQPDRQRAEREAAEEEAAQEQEREAERVALQDPDELKQAIYAVARELGELRGAKATTQEFLAVYDRHNGNLYRIFKWYQSELQKAKEMAAA